MKPDVNDFNHEIECMFEEERYFVRDNGAVYRHARIGKRARPNDNKWTFGKENLSNPYLHLSDARIHRIVATAFHGVPPNPKYVVDHIDTNCRNNRPENLQWLSRLDNALMNPATRKKIEFLCGGNIETFLDNPSMLNTYDMERNFAWMRTVTAEEAQNCKERMSIWANSNKNPRGGSWGEFVYEPIKNKKIVGNEPELQMALEQLPSNDKHESPYPSIDVKASESSSYGWLHAPVSDWVYEPLPVKKKFGMEPIERFAPMEETFSEDPELVMALTEKCIQYKWRVPNNLPCCPKELSENPLDAYFHNLKVGAVFAYNDFYPESTIIEFVKTKNNCNSPGTSFSNRFICYQLQLGLIVQLG